MTKSLKQSFACAYCGDPANESDHVIARQFFPADQVYRGGLPQVPACRTCNGAKQKVEDGPGVIFQFGHSSEASRQLLLTRVPRTLQKNRRLHGALRRSLRDVVIKRQSGVLVPSLAFMLSPRELSDIWDWFQYVARGLYYFEFCQILPTDHTIHLVKPATFEHFASLRDLIVRDPKRQAREYAAGEFRYVYTYNEAEQLTMWLLAIKSIDMFWLTVGSASAAVVPVLLADIEWKAPRCNREDR
jgi:hypothetical protein